jgi:hypothetical protein
MALNRPKAERGEDEEQPSSTSRRIAAFIGTWNSSARPTRNTKVALTRESIR